MDDQNAVNPEMVKAELKRIGDQIKEAGERALAEAKRSGDMSAELKPKVDELLVTQGELKARLQAAEQAIVKRPEDNTKGQSIGERLVGSPEFKSFMDGGGIKSPQSGLVFPLKAALITTDSSVTHSVGVAPDAQPLQRPLQRRLRVRALLAPGRTASNMIMYAKESGYTNNAAMVSEGASKPESTLTFTEAQEGVKTLAHWLKASKQILDDMAQLQSYIDGRLRFGLGDVEDQQLLKGSGVGNNLNGIYTQATAYSAPISVASPTRIDVLRLMILQVELADAASSGIVLHPADWAAIELTKDTTGGYIFANPQNLANATLWGLPVVATRAMTIDTALVGDFAAHAQVFDREDANVVIATENSDDFVKNLITIRAEERLALAVYRPAAFVKNTNLPAS